MIQLDAKSAIFDNLKPLVVSGVEPTNGKWCSVLGQRGSYLACGNFPSLVLRTTGIDLRKIIKVLIGTNFEILGMIG